MSAVLLHHTSGSTGTASTTFTVTIPSTTAGSWLIVKFGNTGAANQLPATITDNGPGSGSSYGVRVSHFDATNVGGSAIWRAKWVAAGITSVTITTGGGSPGPTIEIEEWSGLLFDGPVAQSVDGAVDVGGLMVTAGSLSLVAAGIATALFTCGNNWNTPGTGYTATDSPDTHGNGTEYQIFTGPASTQPSATQTPTGASYDAVAAIFYSDAPGSLQLQQRTLGLMRGAPLGAIFALGRGIWVTPPVSTSHVYSESIAESITAPSDSVGIHQVLARSISESITAPSDSVARATVEARSIAESITAPSDAVARAAGFARSISESITSPSDAVSRATVEARSVAESITAPSDSVSRAFVGARAIAESVSAPSDSVARTVAYARAISESITAPSDAVARGTVEARSIAESITAPSDAVAIQQVLARGISESITSPSDSVAGIVTIPVTGAPTLVLQQRTFGLFVGAPLPAGGVLGQGIWISALTPNPSISVFESITSPSDSVARVFAGARSIAESITAPSDGVARQEVLARAISESITAPSDAVVRVFVGARGIAESVTAPTDSITRTTVEARGLAESIAGPSDSVAGVVAFVGLLSESVTSPSDAVARVVVGHRAIAESIPTAPPTDSVSSQTGGNFSEAIAESITVPTDLPADVVAFVRSIGESIATPTDSVAFVFGIAVQVSESIGAPTDLPARAFIGARVINESITTPSDAIAVLLQTALVRFTLYELPLLTFTMSEIP
jgi:hypothetical protein